MFAKAKEKVRFGKKIHEQFIIVHKEFAKIKILKYICQRYPLAAR